MYSNGFYVYKDIFDLKKQNKAPDSPNDGFYRITGKLWNKNQNL